MKYRIRISDRSYDVEIEDIHARPIIARVDGQRFEVQPENGKQPEVQDESTLDRAATLPVQEVAPNGTSNELIAPLPGTIIEFFVKPGDAIEAGKVVVVIEAMKMKNSIRSTRAGKVSAILASPGQSVAHKQALVRFE